MTSIRAVAEAAQVSPGTVSKVLNNRVDAQVSAATRERIHAAAREVGYHPSAIARGLAGKRMNSVGLVMAYHQASVTADSYLGPCLDGVLHINKLRRQKTVLFTEDTWEAALEHLPAYCDGHCDGLMLIIPRIDSAIVEALKARQPQVPFLLVGDSRDDGNVAWVDVDNKEAARAAVAHLLGLDHRRIAAFCGNADFCSSGQRLVGYEAALADADIAPNPDYIFAGEYRQGWGRANALAFLDRFENREHERPTAIFCFNDSIASGVLDAFEERAIRVPDDISVIGFNDAPQAAQTRPALTTVRQSTRLIGERAAQTMLGLIDGSLASGHHETVPVELILRASTGSVPSYFATGKKGEL